MLREVWPSIVAEAKTAGVKIGIENCPMLFSKDEWPGGKNLAVSPAVWRKLFAEFPDGTLGLDWLDGMTSLAAQSLIQQADGPAAARPRFTMLETIREYGLERLGASGAEETIRRRHAAWCLALTYAAESKLLGRDQARCQSALPAARVRPQARRSHGGRGIVARAFRTRAACGAFSVEKFFSADHR